MGVESPDLLYPKPPRIAPHARFRSPGAGAHTMGPRERLGTHADPPDFAESRSDTLCFVSGFDPARAWPSTCSSRYMFQQPRVWRSVVWTPQSPQAPSLWRPPKSRRRSASLSPALRGQRGRLGPARAPRGRAPREVCPRRGGGRQQWGGRRGYLSLLLALLLLAGSPAAGGPPPASPGFCPEPWVSPVSGHQRGFALVMRVAGVGLVSRTPSLRIQSGDSALRVKHNARRSSRIFPLSCIKLGVTLGQLASKSCPERRIKYTSEKIHFVSNRK